MTAQWNDTLVGNLRKQIEELQQSTAALERDNFNLRMARYKDIEHVRLILVEAIAEDLDVQTVANSVADVFDISLLKEITVAFNISVEATLSVPADYDVDQLELGDVEIGCFNSDVEDFCVQSWEIGQIEEM